MLGVRQKIGIELQSKNGYDIVKGAVYLPENPKAAVQIVVGMFDSKERYEEIIESLCEKGFACIIHDHTGQGESVVGEDFRGIFSLKHGYEYLVRDTYRFAREAKKYIPEGLKLFIFGHSLGSLIARLGISRFDIYSGAILSATAGPSIKYSVDEYILRKEIVRYGESFVNNHRNGIVFKKLNKRTKQITKFDWVSSDANEVDSFIEDRMYKYKLKIVALKDVIKLADLANRKHTYMNIPEKFPIYIFSGDNDPVGNYGKGVKKVYSNYKSISKADVTLRLFKNKRHEILHETNKKEVLYEILEWLRVSV